MKGSLRGLWLAYALLLGFVLGTGGSLLAWVAGESPAKAAITGGAAFTAAVTLALMILKFVDPASGQ
jgi:hypothetical protein